MVPGIIPYISSITYDDVDSSTLLISTLHYTLSSTSLQSVRLIVVSKESSEGNYTDIEHYTDLIKTQLTNTYVLNLQPKFYKFVIEETNSSGVVTCIRSEEIDLTNLQARPTSTFTNRYRNAIVITTNIDEGEESIYFTGDTTFNFVIDAYDLTNNCSELIILSNTNSDVDVVDGKYVLHLCDLSVNTNYLIVYHVEYKIVDNNGSITDVVTKDSDELSDYTTNDGPSISNLVIEYYVSGSYPGGSSSPTGFTLSWTSAQNSLFDPNCQDSAETSRYKIERKDYGASSYTLMTDASGISETTYVDNVGLVAGNVYTYRITAGLYNSSTQITTYIPSIPSKNVPFYTKPDALAVDVTNKEVCSDSDTYYVNSTNVTVTWTSPALHGYQILNNTIHIEDDDEDVPISDGTYTFSGLTNGTTYTKNFTFGVVNSNWYDLSENAASPYSSYTTTKSFIPYGNIGSVTGLEVVFFPEFANPPPPVAGQYGTATGDLSWNAVSSSGLDASVNYYVTITDNNLEALATNPLSPLFPLLYQNYNTTNNKINFSLTQGHNYTFAVYAQQTDCGIIKTSSTASVSANAEHQSSAVQSLSVNYKALSYVLPASGVEVTPITTSVEYVNYIDVSANKPATPSWPTGSFYDLDISSSTFKNNRETIGRDTDTDTSDNSLFNTTIPYYFDATTIADEDTSPNNGLVNGTQYTFTITPYLDLVYPYDNKDKASGIDASTNFTFYKVPTVSNVALVVNNDETMTITWESDINGNYDIYLKDLSANSTVFKGRETNSTRSYIVVSTGLIAGHSYKAYVRPWANINSRAYINIAEPGNTRKYSKQPTISLPVYSNKSSTDPTILTATQNLNPTISANGCYNIHYELRYISYTSEGNSDIIIENHEYSAFELGGTSSTSTDPVNDYDALPLTQLGYYKFQLYITQYTDPNTLEVYYLSDELNNLIPSNSSDFFYRSIPSVISNTIVGIPGTDASYNYTLRVDAYNNWSNITNGLAVIIPRNPSSFTGETLKLYNGTNTTADNNNSNTNSVILQYYITNGLTDRATFIFGGITSTYEPITKKFIVLTNAVGLTYYTDA
jgi:hypothetical protein